MARPASRSRAIDAMTNRNTAGLPAAARRAIPTILLAAALAAGCKGRPDSTPNATYRIDARGAFRRSFTSSSPEAARLCEQGLLLCYAFQHAEATRRFEEASKLDPRCAMARWGVALAAGPNINDPSMDAERCRAAWSAIRDAAALSAHASPVERALIEALAVRYADPAPADRAALNREYADAMRRVAQQYPDDLDVAALFAEALMNVRPWDHWSKDGEPRPETPEIVATLEGVLARNPNHPAANHFLIHALEASPRPEKALPAANRLRDLIPEAGHLVHMPSHIDIRLGRYKDAIEANRRGIAADEAYLQRVGAGGFYAMYRAHNYHFLVYAAMFDGQSQLALRTARELVTAIPPAVVAALPDVLDGFLATPYHVMERFGMWEEILREPAPDPKFPVTVAFHHFARALASAALGRMEDAEAEQKAFETAIAAVPESSRFGNNSSRDLLELGRALLAGELLYRRGKADAAFEKLREAARRDGDLAYDEPWGWMVPASHALGALLLESGRLEEAEQVYREDLKRHPGNGWSLHGLAECRRRAGDAAGAESVEEMFRHAWVRADLEIPGSCFCRAKSAD